MSELYFALFIAILVLAFALYEIALGYGGRR